MSRLQRLFLSLLLTTTTCGSFLSSQGNTKTKNFGLCLAFTPFLGVQFSSQPIKNWSTGIRQPLFLITSIGTRRPGNAANKIVCHGINGDDEHNAKIGGNPSSSSASSSSSSSSSSRVASNVMDYFPLAEILQFELKEHKPLGCTVEESLFEEVDGAKHVFVSKITEGGNAAKAGIQVGDVIIGLSGTFDEIAGVVGLGLDRVRSLVGGRFEDQSLTIQVARGTDVMARHDSALVDMCTLPGNDESFNECLDNIVNAKMDFEEENDVEKADCTDGDVDCMIDAMYGMWNEEMPPPPPTVGVGDGAEGQKGGQSTKTNARPWSSRSSPSGTYVRDPRTGEMRNIDAS